MVMDYRERKPVSKNRPRRQPAGIFFFSIFVAVIIAYTLGLVTGWMVFRPGRGNIADNRNVATESTGKDGGAQPNANEPAAAVNNEPVKEPTLTFYETLPKGNRELIGSGLNLPKSPEAPVVTPHPPQRQAPPTKETVPQESAQKMKEAAKPQEKVIEAPKSKEPVPSKETTTTKETPVKEDVGKGRFVVQAASYQVRQEAEELRDRLKASGIPAYIVESRIAGKGTFFRVRAGKHMEQKAAQELAEKTVKGAIIIPE